MKYLVLGLGLCFAQSIFSAEMEVKKSSVVYQAEETYCLRCRKNIVTTPCLDCTIKDLQRYRGLVVDKMIILEHDLDQRTALKQIDKAIRKAHRIKLTILNMNGDCQSSDCPNLSNALEALQQVDIQ